MRTERIGPGSASGRRSGGAAGVSRPRSGVRGAGAGAAVLLLLAGCGGEAGGGAPGIGEPAPEYTVETLDGRAVRLADFRGRPVLLNFWATWCAPCRTETPFLQRIHERYRDEGLQVLGVSMDSPGATEGIRSFMDEMGVTYVVLHDPRQEGLDRFSILGLPATYVLDGEGTVRFSRIGPVSESDREFLSTLDELTS